MTPLWQHIFFNIYVTFIISILLEEVAKMGKANFFFTVSIVLSCTMSHSCNHKFVAFLGGFFSINKMHSVAWIAAVAQVRSLARRFPQALGAENKGGA